MNFEFMTIDTSLPPCMPFPRALTGFPVSSTAKVMYCGNGCDREADKQDSVLVLLPFG